MIDDFPTPLSPRKTILIFCFAGSSASVLYISIIVTKVLSINHLQNYGPSTHLLACYLLSYYYQMSKQLSVNKKIGIPVLSHQSLERYSSLPRIYSNRSIESFNRQYSLHSNLSSMSQMDASRRLYVSKSPAFFRKLSIDSLSNARAGNSPTKEIVYKSKREVDVQFVLERSKKLFQTKVNPRLMVKSDPITKISQYDSFSPFKRTHEISKHIDSIQRKI